MPTLRSHTSTTSTVGGGSSTRASAVDSYDRRIKSALVQQFDSYVDLAMELKPFSTSNGIKFVGVLDKSLISNKVRKLVRNEFNCSSCNKNAALLIRMVGTNTHEGGFCQRLYSSSTPSQAAIYVALNNFFRATHNSSSSSLHKFELRVLPHPSYTPRDTEDPANATLRAYKRTTTEADPDSKFFGETFKHYHYPGDKCGREFNDDIYKMQRALDKYTILINELLTPLTCRDLISIHDSIKVLQDDILPSATYASRLNHGVRWFKSILDQMAVDTDYVCYNEWCVIPVAKKMEIIGGAILGEKIAFDETDGEATITAYHQVVGSVWSVLKMDGNRARILRTLEERYCPEKYMQTSKVPSVGKLQNAMSALGDYTCYVHSLESLVEAGAPVVMLRGSPPTGGGGGGGSGGSSMSVMNELMAQEKARSNTSKFGLASRLVIDYDAIKRRIQEAHDRENRLRISTMTELMDRVKTGEIWDLRVCATDREVVWLGGFTGDKVPKMLCTDGNWGWQFTKEVSVSGIKNVAAIVPIINKGGFTNWVFIYDSNHSRSVPKLDCPIRWPGIIKTEYFKKYGDVFSTVGKKMKVEYPEGFAAPIHRAIGCGTTQDTSTTLVTGIRVYINGSDSYRYIMDV